MQFRLSIVRFRLFFVENDYLFWEITFANIFWTFCLHRNATVYRNKYVMTTRVFQVNDVLIMTPIWWHCVKLIRTLTGLSNHRINTYPSDAWPCPYNKICAWIIVYFPLMICVKELLSSYEMKTTQPPFYTCIYDTTVAFWNVSVSILCKKIMFPLVGNTPVKLYVANTH